MKLKNKELWKAIVKKNANSYSEYIVMLEEKNFIKYETKIMKGQGLLTMQ